ncbi:hypothetical protein [Gemmatimonas sp.]|jgi:hypothetical protein|uniref:hypothetical protein n=1 Tax=Gemmatimonas sp. TaxID=1962908 RepID=UPI0037C160F9
MAHNVLVVPEQQIGVQLREVMEPGREREVEAVDVVFVQPFQGLVPQGLGQLLEALHLEERQDVLVEDQLVREGNLGLGRGAAGPGGGSGGGTGCARSSSWHQDGLPGRDRLVFDCKQFATSTPEVAISQTANPL